MTYHCPVLLKLSIDGLIRDTSGVYVDATFGGGGHSAELFRRLKNGHLFVFDHDKDVLIDRLKFTKAGCAFTFIESSFRHIRKFLRIHGVVKVNGILADLGVSSHQFDVAERGFSVRFDGPLDMRMDQRKDRSALHVINELKEEDLVHMLSQYGEIRNARTLSRQLVSDRQKKPIKTTRQLKESVLKCVPIGRKNQYLAKVFQAIRIEVNDEMDALKDFLTQAGELLKQRGRLAVISYHSLEDRLVKNFINKGNFKGIDKKDLYGNPIRVLEPITRKPVIPSEEEINKNSRARSAKLRIGQKIG